MANHFSTWSERDSIALHIFVDKLFCVGETADTLNALRYCKERGALIVGITNTGIKNQQCVQH